MRKVIALLCLLVAAGSLYGRTWTDTKGRTVDAILVRIDKDSIVVMKDRTKSFRIPIVNLSEEDQAFIAKERAKQEANAAEVKVGGDGDSSKFRSKVAKELDGKLVDAEGKPHSLGFEPRFVAYYFSRSG